MDETTTSTTTVTTAQEAAMAATNAAEQAAQAKETSAESAEIARLKNALSKANSESAELKKQLRSRMSEDEAAKADNDAKWAEMEEKVARLEREKTESIYKAKYLAMPGFDEKLAEETAKAMAAGNTDKVFENQQKAYATYEKQLRAELVKKDPRPDGAGGGSDDKSAGEKIAERIGKNRAEAATSANEILKHFTGGV